MLKRKPENEIDHIMDPKRTKIEHSISYCVSLQQTIKVLSYAAFQNQLPQNVENCIKDLQNIDRQLFSKLFEAVVAYHYDLLLWENLPCELLEEKNALRYRNGFPDFGIDCASVDLSKAIQAKWYKPKEYVSFRSAATFHGYSDVLGVKERKIVSSQDTKLCSTGMKLPGMQHETISDEQFAKTILECCNAEDKEEEQEQNVEMKVETQTGKDEKQDLAPLPRKYQIEAVETLCKAIESGKIVTKCQICCGAGKTLVINGVLRQMIASKKKCIVFEPSILLQDQVFSDLSKWNPTWKIARVGGGHELKSNSTWDVIVCTFQSVEKISHLEFDLVICDEGHHLESLLFEPESEEEESEGDDEEMEEEEKNKEKELNVVGGKQEKKMENIEQNLEDGYLQKMANLQTNQFLIASATLDCEDGNEPDYIYTLEQAITEGYLCDYEICIPVFSDEKGNRDLALANLIKENASVWTKTLAYCNSRVEGQAFAQAVNDVGLRAVYIDGETPLEERKRLIQEFEQGKFQVIVSVYVFGEGINIVPANTCLFVQGRHSHKNIIQCFGRVLRLHAGKHMAHVVLPATDQEKELARFLRIIGQNDTRLQKSAREGKKGRINLVYSGNQDTKTISEIESVAVFNRIGQKILFSKDDSRWEMWLELLLQFVQEKKRTPRTGEIYCDMCLGIWCVNQRMRHKNGKLSTDRSRKLERVTGWSWSPLDALWHANLILLRKYVEEKGQVPAKHEKYDGVALGMWCGDQRKAHSNGELSADRTSFLEQIKHWSWHLFETSWQDNFVLLRKYVAERNQMPTRYGIYHGVVLGKWISNQITAYKADKLSVDRIRSLEQIRCWSWFPRDTIWPTRLALLQKYVAENGKTPVQKEIYQGFSLGKWCSRQREAYQKRKLSIDRIRALESIKYWVWNKSNS